MSYYITCGELQQHLKQYYFDTGRKFQFTELTSYLYKRELLSSTPSQNKNISLSDDITDEKFESIVDSLVIPVDTTYNSSVHVEETDMFPNKNDVFIIRHPRYTRSSPHIHNYFEINYVQKGSCSFLFENDNKELHKGDVCIIAPSSIHDLVINDNSTIIYTIMIRKSTFDTTFFSLLSQKNLLSYFFRNILQNENTANYLLFNNCTDDILKKIIRHLMLECYRNDTYSNNCCINWINLFFSNLLRNYSRTLQFYNYKIGSDFSLILQYIQKNYSNLTLNELASTFHYTEPYMSTLIKQNIGYNFSDLIKKLRMTDAIDYLCNTDMKINEIAEKIGYNSTDHFSRVFRSIYKISPQAYRKLYKL